MIFTRKFCLPFLHKLSTGKYLNSDARDIRRLYNHDPNAVDYRWMHHGRAQSLRGRKNDIWDGGHRVPFIVRWPGKLEPRVDQINVVSLLDIYGTMADVLNVERECNEAPDSRSLWPLLTQQITRLEEENVIHHGMNGATVALRQRQYKWIPENNELFQMEVDPEEKNNLFGKWHTYTNKALAMNATLNQMLDTISARELRTKEGSLNIC